MFWCCCNAPTGVIVCTTFEMFDLGYGYFTPTDEDRVVTYPGTPAFYIRNESPVSGITDNFDIVIPIGSINLPQGTVCTNVELEWSYQQPFLEKAGTLCGDLTAYDGDDSSVIPLNTSTAGEINSLPRIGTSIEVCIDLPGDPTPTPVSLPNIDITSIVNVMLARVGWSSGNEILLILQSNNNTIFTDGDYVNSTITFNTSVQFTYEIPCP